MGYFSNGTEGLVYQEQYCYRCVYWDDDVGCPIWFLHELHVGEPEWQPTLDRLIPMVETRHKFKASGQCSTFFDRGHDLDRARPGAEPPLRPGQQAGLEEWRQRAQRSTVVVANL